MYIIFKGTRVHFPCISFRNRHCCLDRHIPCGCPPPPAYPSTSPFPFPSPSSLLLWRSMLCHHHRCLHAVLPALVDSGLVWVRAHQGSFFVSRLLLILHVDFTCNVKSEIQPTERSLATESHLVQLFDLLMK